MGHGSFACGKREVSLEQNAFGSRSLESKQRLTPRTKTLEHRFAINFTFEVEGEIFRAETVWQVLRTAKLLSHMRQTFDRSIESPVPAKQRDSDAMRSSAISQWFVAHDDGGLGLENFHVEFFPASSFGPAWKHCGFEPLTRIRSAYVTTNTRQTYNRRKIFLR